jgi:Na+/citrate or Na+/malate symporter
VRIILAGVIGAAGGAVLVWFLATWHHWDLLPDDVQAAVSALIGGALSFLGGYIEHRRAARAAAKDADTRHRDGGG